MNGRPPAPPAPEARPGRALVDAARAKEAARNGGPTPIERAAGYLTAVHLVLHAFLTITTVVGRSWRVCGHLR